VGQCRERRINRLQVGIQATLEQVESALWFSKMTRRDYQVALNLTGAGVDDPDANFYQNYKCGSPRNYSDLDLPRFGRHLGYAARCCWCH
jgi:peptide/nickel transport system substrate-binding protein